MFYQVLKEKAIDLTDSLIKKIELQISNIYKSKNDLEYQYKVMADKYQRLKHLIGEITKLYKVIVSINKALENLSGGAN